MGFRKQPQASLFKHCASWCLLFCSSSFIFCFVCFLSQNLSLAWSLWDWPISVSSIGITKAYPYTWLFFFLNLGSANQTLVLMLTRKTLYSLNYCPSSTFALYELSQVFCEKVGMISSLLEEIQGFFFPKGRPLPSSTDSRYQLGPYFFLFFFFHIFFKVLMHPHFTFWFLQCSSYNRSLWRTLFVPSIVPVAGETYVKMPHEAGNMSVLFFPTAGTC